MITRFVSSKSFVVASFAAVAAIGAYSVLPANAQQAPGQPAPGQGPAGSGEERQGRGQGGMNLEGAMKLMERSYKAMARQINDPAKDEATLKAVSGFQQGAAVSKGLMPHEVDEKEGDARTATAAEYRKLMLDVLKLSIELEDALIAGERDAAKAALKKIHDMEEAGHEKFRPDEHAH